VPLFFYEKNETDDRINLIFLLVKLMMNKILKSKMKERGLQFGLCWYEVLAVHFV
jgi:hypothetical protein